MHEPDDFPEVEDNDLTPASCRTQRPPDESPPELFWVYVGHVGPEDGGPQDLAAHRKLGHILRDDGDLGQFGHLRSSKKRLDVAGDTILVYAWHDSVSGFADLAGHTPPRRRARRSGACLCRCRRRRRQGHAQTRSPTART